jgi:hypothetical protein
MGHLEPEKLHFAEPSHKSSLYDCHIGVYAYCALRPFFTRRSLSRSYPHSRLLEINSHSLFSRWFSESGKLVQKLFGSVMDLVEDEDTFVVVLIGTFLACTVAILVSSYDVCTYR